MRGVAHHRLAVLDADVEPDVLDITRAAAEEDEVAGLERSARWELGSGVELVLGAAGQADAGSRNIGSRWRCDNRNPQ